MTFRSALQKHGSSPVLIEGDTAYAASAVGAAALGLAESLKTGGYRRLIVRSPSALANILAIAAAQEAGIDLFLAHGTLPDSSLDRLAETHAIDGIIEGSAGLNPQVRPIGAVGRANRGKAAPKIHIMTSGTTGEPKVAAHTFSALAGKIRETESSAAARWLLTFPTASFAGLQVILTSVLGLGTLIAGAVNNPEALAEAAEKHEASHISGTPSFWRAFLLALGDAKLPSLRQITLGGEAVDQPILNLLARRFPGARIAHIYASTEAGSLLTVTDGREGFPAEWLSTGAGEVKLRISDGMLEVQSPRRMVGYVSGYADPSTEDGWIRTGDMVRVEGDRVLFMGRSDTRINVGGYKVCVEEVERALLAVEGIADARVVGVPNPLTGQALRADVLYARGADPEEVRLRAIRDLKASLESYKVPRLFRTMDAPDLAPSGKKARTPCAT
jgi:acyl-CoA synthetase (AMP-forming)/AMP-acid ligase II